MPKMSKMRMQTHIPAIGDSILHLVRDLFTMENNEYVLVVDQ